MIPNALALFLAVALVALPFEQRYALVDGPDFRIVSARTFAAFRPNCRSLEFRTYPREHVKVHICNL
jgi:hypothetical protein